MNILRMLFIPPQLEDYEQDKRAKFFHLILWVSIVFGVYIGFLKINAGSFSVAAAVFFLTGFCFIALILNGFNKYFWAASVFSIFSILVVFINLYDGLALYAPGIISPVIVITFSGFLFGKRSIIPITLFNIIGIIFIVYAERSGMIDPPLLASNSQVAIILGQYIIAGVLLWAIIDNWDRALENVIESKTQIRDSLEQVSQMRDELEVHIEERTADLQLAVNDLESFAYSVSHDLRAPLRAINGFSEILKSEYSQDLSEEAQDYLDRIIASGLHMDQLIDDMLLLSRVGRRTLSPEPCDLTAVVEKVFEELAEDEQGREITLQAAQGIEVNADANLMEILFTNLISNAIKFSRDKLTAMVEFGCEQQNGQNLFFVRDNGVGFDMEYADKLFTPFQRLHERDAYEGSGIGLAIVKRIIRHHEGDVWIESQVNRGTTVYFTFGKDLDDSPTK